MRLLSAAFASRNQILRKFKNTPQERIVRNLTTRSRHQAYGNILRSLKGSGSLQKANFLQPVSPVLVPAAGFLPFSALKVVGSVALRLTNIRYILLLGGTAGGVSVYKTIEEWKEKFSGVNAFIAGVKELVPKSLPNLSLPTDWLSSKFSRDGQPLDFDGFLESVTAKASQAGQKASTVLAAEAAEGKATPKEKTEKELSEQILQEMFEYQNKLEKLMKENRELRKQVMLRGASNKEGKIKFTTTDMYSSVLDELAAYNQDNDMQDHLPRVVVVGDQSAGKTSVLEMIAQARIFPRGSGEMMTRSPVKVTMSEGIHHIAKFHDSYTEYDLTNETELEALRKEIEERMKRTVGNGRTVSNETISLTIKGPGLKRMVLVDLPGVISTVTMGMASDTGTKIKDMCRSHMENPNAIILCIQDGSLDAEKSIVTDLVSSMDPSGKRTIFVMTKVDVAEKNQFNPDRIKKTLEGKLFPMKALGYFGVVTGKGNAEDSIDDIKKYEEEFFKSSALLKDGILKSKQLSTDNLSQAVSDCFWKMVQESVEEEAQKFKTTSNSLQRVWDYKFQKHRMMDREEFFAKASSEILDEVVNTSRLSDKHWETTLKKKVWDRISDDIFNIYLKASAAKNQEDFNITADVELTKFADKTLPLLCMEVGQDTLQSEFKNNLFDKKKSQDPLVDKIKVAVSDEKHQWNQKSEQYLRMYALKTLQDKELEEKQNQAAKFEFMENVVKEKLAQAESEFSKLMGPGSVEMWTYWKSRTPEQNSRRQTVAELEKMIKNEQSTLDKSDLIAIKKNLESQSVVIDDAFIQETWTHLRKMNLLRKALSASRETQEGGYLWDYWGSSEKKPSRDLVFFQKIESMLGETSSILRQQLIRDEVHRFERKVKESLNNIADDEQKLKSLLQDERVEIVEKLKHVRQIQELLDKFIETLKKDKA